METVPQIATAYEVYRWPEFQALCDRLCIPLELRTVGLIIDLHDQDKPVSIVHTYHGMDKDKPIPVSVDTTTYNNELFRTKIVNPRIAPSQE